jgi:hypothetical protein
MRLALFAVAVAALAAGCGGGSTTTVTVTRTVSHTKTVTVPVTTLPAPTTAPCLASALAGVFAGVPGSAGAGNITYRLRVTNQGDATCFVTGLPSGVLLDQNSARLPTNISPAHPGATAAPHVDLAPGDAATADARFSPDVPGSTEGDTGQCEPKSYTFQLNVGDGTVDAPVRPPTPVCERGTLFFDAFTAAK